ncbi:MAG: FecR domain-containing protein, partial [Pseudomonadales bacterium]
MNMLRDKLHPLKLISMLLLLGLWSITASAQGLPAGTVLTVSGDVIAEAESGESRTLSRRSPVFSGDTIVAADDARIRFKLLDDSSYVVQENSSFTIKDFYFNGSEDGTEAAEFYFAEGVMEFISGNIGKQDTSKFRIETEFAVIGLRGSGGIIRTDSEATRVFVTLGELSARSRTGDLFVLNNGETTVIGLSGEPERDQGNSTGAPQTMTTDGDDIVSNDPAEQQGEEQEQVSEEDATEESGSEAVVAEEPEEANEASEVSEQASDQSATESRGDEQNASVNPPPSAAEIFAGLLPDPLSATQEDLQSALSRAIEGNPVLYAELVTIAIDMGLEPPNAA